MTLRDWLIALLCAVLVGLALDESLRTWLKKRILEICGRSWSSARVFLANPIRGRDLLQTLFEFRRETVHLVYTCRAKLDHAPHPTTPEGLKHSVLTHVPIDEFFTYHSAIRFYRPQLSDGHETLDAHLHCSSTLENFWPWRPFDISEMPEFMFENLIVIGENACSNFLLDELKPITVFGYKRRTVGQPDGHQEMEWEVSLNPLDEALKETFRTWRDELHMNGNAVAMICYAPNPFNLRKSVLLLYGCHRFGQALLEHWLDSRRSVPILKRIRRSGTPNLPLYGQIALHSLYTRHVPERYEFHKSSATENADLKHLFYQLPVRENAYAPREFRPDLGAVHQEPMVDISLVALLGAQDRNLTKGISDLLRQELNFLHDAYWEMESEVGLHVTLYEFATHEGHNTLREAQQEHFPNLEGLRTSLALQLPAPLIIGGLEVTSDAIILRAHLSPDFIGAVQTICRNCATGVEYLNRSRVPFPLHCTFVRLKSVLNEDQKNRMHSVAAKFRKRHFGQFEVQILSLLLMRAQPYRDPYGVRIEISPPSTGTLQQENL